jgi:hypothetical protein
MLHLRKANPTVVFLLIAFGVPWSVQVFMALKRIPLVPVWPSLILANSFCSVAGFVAAYCELGWAGVTDLGHRCLRYRASKGWWACTLLLCFGIANVTSIGYGLVHGVVGPLRLQDLARQGGFRLRFFSDLSSARSVKKPDGVVTCFHIY